MHVYECTYIHVLFPQSMMEMFGKLHQAYRKVVDISETGRRYLGTYFRVAFYGKVCGGVCLCVFEYVSDYGVCVCVCV